VQRSPADAVGPDGHDRIGKGGLIQIASAMEIAGEQRQAYPELYQQKGGTSTRFGTKIWN
jgi:hypothetical protein